MFNILNPWKYAGIAAITAAILLLIWGSRIDYLRESWKNRYEKLSGEVSIVLDATRLAGDNSKLQWDGVAGQITAIGNANAGLKAAIGIQNKSIAVLAEEAVRLKAKASELRAIADKAQAQRQAALSKLDEMAITPGTRADCQTLLKEAEDALDLVRDAGL